MKRINLTSVWFWKDVTTTQKNAILQNNCFVEHPYFLLHTKQYSEYYPSIYSFIHLFIVTFFAKCYKTFFKSQHHTLMVIIDSSSFISHWKLTNSPCSIWFHTAHFGKCNTYLFYAYRKCYTPCTKLYCILLK